MCVEKDAWCCTKNYSLLQQHSSVNDVAKSEKQNDDLSHDEFDSNDALDFDDDVLQKAY